MSKAVILFLKGWGCGCIAPYAARSSTRGKLLFGKGRSAPQHCAKIRERPARSDSQAGFCKDLDGQKGRMPMQQIAELERRITAALERIGRGVDGLAATPGPILGIDPEDVARLNEALDDFNRRVFSLQVDGSKTGLELPGIVDEVVTLTELKSDDGTSYRAFVCHTLNNWGYPAKDRSGQLEMLEPPNLLALIEKCAAATQPQNNKE